LQLNAFKITQRGGLDNVEIYVAVFRAIDIIDRTVIDRWTVKNPGGYQRQPSEHRLSFNRGSIVRYLVKELGCFPTSVLINIRGDVEYEKVSDMGWLSYGTLDTGDNRLWVIDGQHRLEALKRAIERNRDFEDYPVIASVLRLPERFDEMMLFYIVNRRQRSVPTDLVYRHLQRMMWQKGVQWVQEMEGSRGVRIGFATEVVDQLQSEPASPWHGRIHVVGEPSKEEYIASDSLFIKTLADVLREKVYEGVSTSEFSGLMIDYWNAVYQLYPECFTSPADYTLLGTPGVQVMHMLFPVVHARCLAQKDVSEAAMEKQLEKLLQETPGHSNPDLRNPVDSEFWSKAHGPLIAMSKSGENIKRLYFDMLEKMRLAEESNTSPA